mgnify:CR=1 FL=1
MLGTLQKCVADIQCLLEVNYDVIFPAVLVADALMGRHHCTEEDVYRLIGAYLKWAIARCKSYKYHQIVQTNIQ